MENHDHTANNLGVELSLSSVIAHADSQRMRLHEWIAGNEAELLRALRPLAAKIYELRGQGVDETQRELLVDLTAAALTNAERYEAGRNPRPWLLGIAQNIVKQWRDRAIKTNQRTTMAGPSAGSTTEDMAVDIFDRLFVASREPGVEETVIGNEWIGRLLATLKPEEAQLVQLMAIDDYSAEEAGAILHLTPGNVRVKLHRTLKKLRAFESNERTNEERLVGMTGNARRSELASTPFERTEAQTGRRMA